VNSPKSLSYWNKLSCCFNCSATSLRTYNWLNQLTKNLLLHFWKSQLSKYCYMSVLGLLHYSTYVYDIVYVLNRWER